MKSIEFRRSFSLARVLLAVAVLAAGMAAIRAWFAPGPNIGYVWIFEKPTSRTILGARLHAAHRAGDQEAEREVVRAIKARILSPEVLDRARADPRLARFEDSWAAASRERLRRSVHDIDILFQHSLAPRYASGVILITIKIPARVHPGWDEAKTIARALGNAYIKSVGANGSPVILKCVGGRASTGSIPPLRWVITLALVVLVALILVLDLKSIPAAWARRRRP